MLATKTGFNDQIGLVFTVVNLLAPLLQAKIQSSDLNVLTLDVNSILSNNIKISDPFLYSNNNGYDKKNISLGTECLSSSDLDLAVKTMKFHR